MIFPFQEVLLVRALRTLNEKVLRNSLISFKSGIIIRINLIRQAQMKEMLFIPVLE